MLYIDVLQTSMNAYPMEGKVHVHKYATTPLDHFSAAIMLDILCLDMPAMVRENNLSNNAYYKFYNVCARSVSAETIPYFDL